MPEKKKSETETRRNPVNTKEKGNWNLVERQKDNFHKKKFKRQKKHQIFANKVKQALHR